MSEVSEGHTLYTDAPTLRLAQLRLCVLEQIDLSSCSGCDQCGLRCEAGVHMSREEYRAVQQYVTAADDRDEIARVAAQDKAVDLGDGVSVRMCRYRDMEGGRCSVYPARPLVCRLLGHVEWMPCPIGKIERIARTSDALALMGEYATRERATFEEWESALTGTEDRTPCSRK